jgi:hypothetical protein
VAREAPGYQGRGPPRRVVSSQNGNAAGYARRFSRFLLYAGTHGVETLLHARISVSRRLFANRRTEKNASTAPEWSLNAWRAATTQCAPSPQACPRTSAPGRAAGGPRRVFVSIQACSHTSAPGRAVEGPGRSFVLRKARLHTSAHGRAAGGPHRDMYRPKHASTVLIAGDAGGVTTAG